MRQISTLTALVATLLVAALPSWAQSFPITIDARPLSAPVISLGAYTFPRATVQNLSLEAGNYTIGYPGSPAVGDLTLAFSVTPAGLISYAPSLEPMLLGNGTSTLTVNGVQMIFNNQFTPMLDLAMSGYATAPIPKTFFGGRFLPGLHRLTYASNPSASAFADFTINATGTVTYSTSPANPLEGVFQGNGTGILRINGAIIQINNTSLSAADVRITGIYDNAPAPHSTFIAAVLPGVHSVRYESSAAGQDAAAEFTVSASSTVSYDAGLQGVLLGAGGGVLTIQGASVAVDNTYLTSAGVNFGGVYDPAPMPRASFGLQLLPGDHDVSYQSTPAGGRAGEVEAITAGTTALTIRGHDVVIDNSYLYATNCELFGVEAALPNDTSVVTLLPGDHVVQYQASASAPAASLAFAVLGSGAVDYDPALEGAAVGAGTNMLRLPGFELSAALPEWDAGSAFIYSSPAFNSCQAIRVLAGWHTLATSSPVPDSIDVLVDQWGAIDFDPGYDADWAGRGTNFLQQRDASGVAQVCNQAPVAIVDPAEITVEATSAGGASVTLSGVDSFDPDNDTLTYHWDVSDLSVTLDDADSPTPSGNFAVGVTMATLTVTDPSGAYSTADVIVRVVDTTPPAVLCSTDMATLWPPNHKMKIVELQVIIDDLAGSASILSATLRSDEPDNAPGHGDGNTTGDTNGSDGFTAPIDITGLFTFDPMRGTSGAWVAHVLLRAERSGDLDGRSYILDVMAIDAALNVSECSSCVVVPKNRHGGC